MQPWILIISADPLSNSISCQFWNHSMGVNCNKCPGSSPKQAPQNVFLSAICKSQMLCTLGDLLLANWQNDKASHGKTPTTRQLPTTVPVRGRSTRHC